MDQVEGIETVVQAQHRWCKEAWSERSVQLINLGLSMIDEVGCDEGYLRATCAQNVSLDGKNLQ